MFSMLCGTEEFSSSLAAIHVDFLGSWLNVPCGIGALYPAPSQLVVSTPFVYLLSLFAILFLLVCSIFASLCTFDVPCGNGTFLKLCPVSWSSVRFFYLSIFVWFIHAQCSVWYWCISQVAPSQLVEHVCLIFSILCCLLYVFDYIYLCLIFVSPMFRVVLVLFSSCTQSVGWACVRVCCIIYVSVRYSCGIGHFVTQSVYWAGTASLTPCVSSWIYYH